MVSEKLKQLLEFSIINVDKPQGPTSFSISDYIRKSLHELGIRKTSHFGTLDPKVTGVLPIALNRACKLTGFFLGHNKTYVGAMHVNNEITEKELQQIINKKFVGKIKQLPPRKSRVKREEREREVISFKILEKKQKDVLFETCVQGGTYIRKLCSDLGEDEKLGGAHMLELRRIKAGIFEEKDSINLYKLQEAVEKAKKANEKDLINILTPAEQAIKKILPYFQVKEQEVKKLLTGKPIFSQVLENPEKLPKDGRFALFHKEQFIEIAHPVSEGDIIARPEFVMN